jgi:hypothetical protein
VWIALVVPPAVLVLAVLLQRLEAAVLVLPAEADPRDPGGADLVETGAAPAPAPRRAPLALVPEPVPPPARTVCAADPRRAATRRMSASPG